MDDAFSPGACYVPCAEAEAVLHAAGVVIQRVQPKRQSILGDLVARHLVATLRDVVRDRRKNLPQERVGHDVHPGRNELLEVLRSFTPCNTPHFGEDDCILETVHFTPVEVEPDEAKKLTLLPWPQKPGSQHKRECMRGMCVNHVHEVLCSHALAVRVRVGLSLSFILPPAFRAKPHSSQFC